VRGVLLFYIISGVGAEGPRVRRRRTAASTHCHNTMPDIMTTHIPKPFLEFLLNNMAFLVPCGFILPLVLRASYMHLTALEAVTRAFYCLVVVVKAWFQPLAVLYL